MRRLMMVAVVVMAGMAWSVLAVPMSITYQGVLSEVVDEEVRTMSGTSATLDVRLWSEVTGGTALWGRQIPVTLDQGAFNMVLNDRVGSQLPDLVSDLESVIQDATTELYIGLTVPSGSEITPRQRLLSAAYAVAAKSAEESASNFAVNGNLIVTGSTEVTGTLTATSVALNSLTVSGTAELNGGATVQGTTLRLRPTAPLVVEGSATVNSLTVAGLATLNGATTVNNTLAVSGAATLNGATTVNNTLAVSGAATLNNTLAVTGAATLNGATTVNGLLTTTNGFWMNGGATVQGNMLRLNSTAPLEVNSIATLKGATTVNGEFKTTGGYWMNGGATVNNSALLLNSGSDLQVQGTFMRRYSLTVPGANGFAEIQFGTPNPKTTKMDIILCITGHNTGLGNKIIAIYINGVVAAQTHILPNAQASLTVPIPKGQTFYMDRDHANVHGFCGYVTTFASSGNNWANIW